MAIFAAGALAPPWGVVQWPPATPKAPAPPALSASAMRDAWCTLQVGARSTDATTYLGAPNDPQDVAAAFTIARTFGFNPTTMGLSADAWSTGPDTLLVTYKAGRIKDLQAYAGRLSLTGPTSAATDLACAAMRDASGGA